MLGYLLAALIGLSLAIMGGGGSILTVPIFVYVMHFEPKTAIAMSLPVVGVTSLAGAVNHWREGNFDLRAALTFGVLAMTGAYVGARLAANVSGIVQLTLLGLVMIASALLMLRRPVRGPGVEPGAAEEATTRHALSARMLPVAIVGLSVGMLTGIVGIGGGFLFVPALVLLARLPMKTAVGTSLLVIALNTAAGSLGYRGQVDVPWHVVLVFTAIAIVGIVLGTRVVRHVSQLALRRAFAYFLFAMAAFILYQNRAVLADPAGALRPANIGAHR
jgi:uncharacterized membrane protein YfcA